MTQTEFDDLSLSALRRGMRKCLESATEHQQAADLLFAKDLHGFAMSHLVLASEEVVKGCVLWMRFVGGRLPENSHRIFSAHWFKHEAGDGLSGVAIRAVEQFSRTITDESMRAMGASDAQVQLKRGADSAMKQLTPNRIRRWWSLANEVRNAGFYVDHQDGVWTRSRIVQRQTFLKAFALVGALMAFLHIQNEIARRPKKRKPHGSS